MIILELHFSQTHLTLIDNQITMERWCIKWHRKIVTVVFVCYGYIVKQK